MQQFTRFPNYLDSYESLKLFNEAMMNDGNDPFTVKKSWSTIGFKMTPIVIRTQTGMAK